MSSAISFHPAIDYFFSLFTARDPKPSGSRVGNMDQFTIAESVRLIGAYYVCAERLNMAVSKFITISGPGGGLVAADKVNLEAPEIDLNGSPEQPIRIVAISDLNIKAQDLKICNVVLYLFGDAHFSISAKRYSRFENLLIVRIKSVDGQIQGDLLANLKDFDSYKDFAAKINRKIETTGERKE
jgi:hypothetical protein